jgi:outer membrane protein OmpU
MTNIKKLGLTALAGSLVATSAYSGALDVSGTAKVTYASQDETEVTGNPFSTTSTIGFSGAGELDNGYNLSYYQGIDAGAFSSMSISLDMGDGGTFSFSNGASKTGMSAYDDVMPTAGEEVWDDLDGQAHGVAGISTANTIGYAGTFAGIGVSASWNKDAGTTTNGASKSIVLTSGDLVDGMEIGFGLADESGTTTNNGIDERIIFAKYTTGPVTVGIQHTEIDVTAVDSDKERLHYAASFAINENLSASVGFSTVEFEASTKDDQDNSGIALSNTTVEKPTDAERFSLIAKDAA